MKKIKLKMSVMSVIITAVVIACVFIVNLIVGAIADINPMKIDLTKDRIYEFSNQTKDVMKELDKEINAYAIIPASDTSEVKAYMENYLEKYSSLNKKFNVKYVDPYVDTAFMSKYESESVQIDIYTVILECGKNRQIITADQFMTSNYFDDTQFIDLEKQMTNAVLIVTEQISESNIYLDVMHTGEDYRQYGLMLAAFLQIEGYKCEEMNMGTEGIPEDADIIVSIVPMYDYTKNEIKLLEEFFDRGGKLVVMGREGMQPLANLDALLLEWGIKINYDYVVELDENSSIPNYAGALAVPVAKYDQQHTITEKLASSELPLVMPNTTSVSVVKSTNGSETTRLITTSEKAYSKKSLETLEKEPGDESGPLGLAAISINMEEKSSGVMVIGSVDGILGQIYENSGNYLNIDFLLNSLSYLGGADQSMDIRAKQITPEEMIVTQQQYKVINIVLVWIIPVVIILLGIVIWLRRRFK